MLKVIWTENFELKDFKNKTSLNTLKLKYFRIKKNGNELL
jgi:hypothetical protein